MRESELTLIPFPDIIIQSLKIRLFFYHTLVLEINEISENSYIYSITRAKFPGFNEIEFHSEEIGWSERMEVGYGRLYFFGNSSRSNKPG